MHLVPSLKRYKKNYSSKLYKTKTNDQEFKKTRNMRKQNCVAIVILLLSAYYLTSCDSCVPSTQNFALIGNWDVPAGQSYTVVEEIPGDQTVDFIGRVYYPSYDEDAIEAILNDQEVDYNGLEVAEGEHPLIIFGHGQYSGAANNYLGMAHLMNHLASWGYICISINLDVLQGNWPEHQQGIPQRGEIFLHAIEYMKGLNSNSGSIFYNRIDVNKIGLIGHSRGGGGAISAVNKNLSEGSPNSILAISTISPVDFYVDPVQGAIPHLSLYGSWDGDLFDGEGPRIWSGGSRQSDKVFVEIYGANHFHFTDAINYASEANEITREDHQEMAQGFINAFFDKYIRNRDRYTWPLYLTGVERLRDVDYFIQYLSHDFEAIDDGSPLGTVGLNNLNGNNDGTSLSLFEDKSLTSFDDHFYNESDGLIMHWDDSGDEVIFNFPVHDASSFSYLCFRVSQRPDFEIINTLDQLKNFTVEVQDAENNTASVQIQDYQGGLQYPDFSQSIQDWINAYPSYEWLFGPHQYKSILRSYRIPFADFAEVNFSQINKVSIIFDKPNIEGFDNLTGAIAFDDLEFSN